VEGIATFMVSRRALLPRPITTPVAEASPPATSL